MLPPKRSHFLMCAPHYFGVEYVINPWMAGNEGMIRRTEAEAQWEALYGLLANTLGACVSLIPPQPHLPDLVFTANAGLIRGEVCVPARFRHAERRGEEPHFRAWFKAHGFTLADLPAGIAFEGAGDALFDTEAEEGAGKNDRPILWAAYGFRSDRAAHPLLAEVFGADVVSLALVDPRFYHLDTCFCPLPGGSLLWFPPAFSAESRRLIEERVPAERRIAVCEADTAAFACNAVGLQARDGSRALVLNAASEALRGTLAEQGFAVHATPLTEFLRAGGAAKCLTLRVTSGASGDVTAPPMPPLA